MNLVAKNINTEEIFESQSFQTDEEKTARTKAIQNDAESAGIEIIISEMTDAELREAIST